MPETLVNAELAGQDQTVLDEIPVALTPQTTCTSEGVPAPPIDIRHLLMEFQEGQSHLKRIDRLFVIGCGKSGTTWLRNVLHGHPNVVIYGEGCFAWQLVPYLNQVAAHFNQHQQHQSHLCRLEYRDLLLHARLLIDSFFQRYIEHAAKPIETVQVVGDKTPQHTIAIDVLNALYPDAKFIHMMRDPRDVATSAWFDDGVKQSPRTFEQFVHHYMNEVWPLQVGRAKTVGPQLGTSRYCEVRYEDLLTNEHDELERVLTFLEVDAGSAVINGCMEAGAFRKHAGGRERGDGDNAQFYRKGVSGDWKNHLPEDLIQRLCIPIADLMRSCGYDPS